MSRAFVKGDDSDLSGEELPERPVSPHPNYVTRLGLAQLRAKYETLLAHNGQLKAAAEGPHVSAVAFEQRRQLRRIGGKAVLPAKIHE